MNLVCAVMTGCSSGANEEVFVFLYHPLTKQDDKLYCVQKLCHWRWASLPVPANTHHCVHGCVPLAWPQFPHKTSNVYLSGGT